MKFNQRGRYVEDTIPRMKKGDTMEQAGGAVWIFKNRNCLEGIFLPLYLCAMDVDCISPKAAKLGCNDEQLKKPPCYSACHRYDQSLTSLVVGNYYNFNKTRYTAVGRLLEKYDSLKYKGFWKPDDVATAKRRG